jgi:ATP-dependent Lhr-like helicase
MALLLRIGRLAGRDLQRIGLSATIGNPEDLLRELAAGSGRPAGFQAMPPRRADRG